MKDQTSDDSIIDRLSLACQSDALPKGAREHAEHLLKRLSSPVRVTLFGKPGAGKSELINMFVGKRILPKELELPTTELVYGEADKVMITSPDGKIHALNHVNLNASDLNQAAYIKIEAPLALLQRISFLEVVTDGTAAAFDAAVDWATRRTDIALWCSQDFDTMEQQIWQRVPDALKDHAFLVLSKADELSARKVLSKRVAALETIVAEEFHSLFAVATLQAIKAQKPDGSVDETLRHASGGGALTSEILRHAERGRRADVDSAELFLARYRIPLAPRPISDRKSSADAKPVAAIEKAATAPVEAPQTKNIALFHDSAQFLRRRADTLEKAALSGGAEVVEQAVEVVEHLVDLFSRDESGCKTADAFLDDLMEASDLMVLMQSETGDEPSADAATLLLQLRREMEEKIAA